MSTKLEDFAAEHGLGRIEARIRLGGRLAGDELAELPVDLCLTPDGAWVIAQGGRFVGRRVDATDASNLRYEPGKLRDRLWVQGAELAVPTGRGAETRRIIAHGRVRRRGAANAGLPAIAPVDRYIEGSSALVWEFVSRALAPADALIGLQRVGEDEAPSAFGANARRSAHLLVSAEQALIVRVSELGDAELTPLDADA